VKQGEGRHRAQPGRPQLLWASAMLAVLLITAGGIALTRHDNQPVDAGAVPTAVRPSVGTPASSGSRVTQFTDAPTVAVPGVPSGKSTESGTAAPTAPTPVGTNVLPIHAVRLQIAAQHIDAPVVDVGVGSRGLNIPPDPRVVGRWDGGANPGEPYGSVVLAGHVDNVSVRGALFNLSHVPVGATVALTGADGRAVIYRVTGLREVPKLNLAALDVFTQSIQARLVLITCGGTFDTQTRSYADNVVAFAVPDTSG
jgi:hypothetical protein